MINIIDKSVFPILEEAEKVYAKRFKKEYPWDFYIGKFSDSTEVNMDVAKKILEFAKTTDTPLDDVSEDILY